MIIVATFGSGQENAGTYVEISCNSYQEASEYMENAYNGKFCGLYHKDDWDKWTKEDKSRGLRVEKKLCSVNLS